MRFNKLTSITNKTVNYAGGEAFVESPKLAFISLLLTSFVQDQYYRSADEGIAEVANLMAQISDKKFPAKAAIYARTKFGMRSISHVVAGEIAKTVKGEQWTKDFFDKIIYRPDDMLEIFSYLGGNKKAITNPLRKGFAKALLRFNEYQLSKYRKEKASVSLLDIVNLVHPKSTPAIEKLMKGQLKSIDTWETQLTQAGQKAKTDEEKEELKKQAWVTLIKERKIGYFALLRNLRNILEQAPEIVDKAIQLLTDEKLIKKSLVLPFRFITALKQIEETNFEGSRDVLIALNRAVDIAVSNVPKFEGKTLVVLDTSGSMLGKPAEIGSLFSAVLVKSNNADFINFSDDAKYQTLNPLDSTITLAKSIEFRSGGTNFHSIFETANKLYNRIIILSDMQGWIGYDTPTKTYAEYKTRTGANPYIYSFDLQGYGTLQFPERNIFCIAGFSEKIFDVIKLLEQNKNALITEIEKIEL